MNKLPIERKTNLGKQVVHLPETLVFLTLITSHKNALIVIVNAGRADDDLAVRLGLLHLPLPGLLQSTIISQV